MPVVIPEPGALLALGLVGVVYARGVPVVWGRVGQGRGVRRWQVGFFATGIVALLIALESPLDWLGAALFAAHMLQHLLLMLVAAPLLVLAAPLLALLWGLPDDVRRGAARLLRYFPAWAGRPAVAFGLHVLAVWAWHVPALYEAALANRLVHAAEHAAFLGTGALFWWALLQARHRHAAYGAGVLYLFGMALQSTLLGALLTFARAPWYASHLTSAADWGLTPLEDQQLAGLIMWVPGGLVYLVAALTLFGVWLTAAAPAPEANTRARRSAERLVSPER